MLSQTENSVHIQGLLSSSNIIVEDNPNNSGHRLRGYFTVQLDQEVVKGQGPKPQLIRCDVFSTEYTKSGKINPSFTSLYSIVDPNDPMQPVSAVGVENATKISIGGADLRLNRYVGRDGQEHSNPSIRCSFVNRVTTAYEPHADFSAVLVLGSDLRPELSADGSETGAYTINGAIVNYDGTADVLPFTVLSENVANALSDYWSIGDTVKVQGKINFTVDTVEEAVKGETFGEVLPTVKTKTVRQLVIVGGAAEPLQEPYALDFEEVKAAIAQGNANFKARQEARKTTKTQATQAKKKNLGF